MINNYITFYSKHFLIYIFCTFYYNFKIKNTEGPVHKIYSIFMIQYKFATYFMIKKITNIKY